MATETRDAPQCPETTDIASDRRARGVRDPRRGQDVLNGRVSRHVEHADDADSGDERDGEIALRALHFAGHHGEIVPAVVGP